MLILGVRFFTKPWKSIFFIKTCIKSHWLARFLCPTPESLSTLRVASISAIKTPKHFTNDWAICPPIKNSWIWVCNLPNELVTINPENSTIFYWRADISTVRKQSDGFGCVDNDSGVGHKNRASHCDFIYFYMKILRFSRFCIFSHIKYYGFQALKKNKTI